MRGTAERENTLQLLAPIAMGSKDTSLREGNATGREAGFGLALALHLWLLDYDNGGENACRERASV